MIRLLLLLSLLISSASLNAEQIDDLMDGDKDYIPDLLQLELRPLNR